MANPNTIQLGEICERLQIRERDARYVLERGYVPEGVPASPVSGNHRQFGPGQAFWLGMVLKLKQAGIKTPIAAEIADLATRALRSTTQNLSWDPNFLPEEGRFETERQYYLELGDGEYVQFVTDASPSGGGRFESFGWSRLTRRGKLAAAPHGYRPCVVVRLDLSLIARQLSPPFKSAT